MQLLSAMGVPPQGETPQGAGGQEAMAGGGAPMGPEMFQMNPAQGPGAPPFTEGLDIIKQAGINIPQ